MKCECGGNLIETKILAYDMSAYVGAKVTPIPVCALSAPSCWRSRTTTSEMGTDAE